MGKRSLSLSYQMKDWWAGSPPILLLVHSEKKNLTWNIIYPILCDKVKGGLCNCWSFSMTATKTVIACFSLMRLKSSESYSLIKNQITLAKHIVACQAQPVLVFLHIYRSLRATCTGDGQFQIKGAYGRVDHERDTCQFVQFPTVIDPLIYHSQLKYRNNLIIHLRYGWPLTDKLYFLLSMVRNSPSF